LVIGCVRFVSAWPLASTKLSPESSSSVPEAPPKRNVARALVTSAFPSYWSS
jgi:hypothetical protein